MARRIFSAGVGAEFYCGRSEGRLRSGPTRSDSRGVEPRSHEKVRAATTDGQGRFTIADLRPGLYTVTFALPGFSTIKREGLEVQSNVTVPLSVELKVGALEETVTVTGASPVVDVQSSTRTQVVSRDLMDAIPNARNLQSIAAMVPASG